MKKKLLSLVLAGAMVASTSVSAFATTQDTQDIQVHPSSPSSTEVEIQGNVESDNGQVLPSTVTVTVPTNASFTVKSDGTLESGNMKVENKGDVPVSVIASSFVDANGTNGINLVKNESDLNSNDRSKVCLKLTGGDKQIILTSEVNSGNKAPGKMYDAANPNTEISDDTNGVIKKVSGRSVLNLKLEGKGSKYSDSESEDTKKAISDSFRLVLKIKQERQ